MSQFFCKSNSSKYFTCLSGKLRTELTSPIAKSTSPGAIRHDFLCTLHRNHAGHPGFHRFRALGSLQFFLGRVPSVRTDQPDQSCRNDNFPFNQKYPARSVKSKNSMQEGDGVLAKTLKKLIQTDWSGHGPASQF